MSNDDLAMKAVADLLPEMMKALEAVRGYGLKCFEAGANMAQAAAQREELPHPDDPKNKEL